MERIIGKEVIFIDHCWGSSLKEGVIVGSNYGKVLVSFSNTEHSFNSITNKHDIPETYEKKSYVKVCEVYLKSSMLRNGMLLSEIKDLVVKGESI